MLGRLFNRSKPAASDPKPGPQLCMVALRSDAGLTPQRIALAWSKLFPGQPELTSTHPEAKDDPDDDKSVLSFETDGRTLMLAVMPAPIPRGDIDGCAPLSWMWPEAAAKMAEHKVHAIALSMPSGNAVQDALDVSRLACAAGAAGDCVGFYWGNAAQLHKPRMFLDAVQSLAKDDGQLPVMLWVGLRISADSPTGPFTLTTHGLRPFGHKEIEIIDTRVGIGDLRMTAFNIINYLLVNGPVLLHGQTFGGSEAERHRIEHTTSKFRKGEPVIRLHM